MYVCTWMVFLWERVLFSSFVVLRRDGNQRLLAVNVLIVSRVVNLGIKCASIPCVLFTFGYIPYILRTKGKGQRSYELERGINWNTFKSITATLFTRLVMDWFLVRIVYTYDKIKTKNLNTTLAPPRPSKKNIEFTSSPPRNGNNVSRIKNLNSLENDSPAEEEKNSFVLSSSTLQSKFEYQSKGK